MVDREVDHKRLGKTLRDLREDSDCTQKELEERSGVAHTIISRLETGAITDPRLSTVRRLAQGLGIRLSEFVDEIMSENDICQSIQAKLASLKEPVRDRFHVKQLGLFGSVARGEDSPGSDVDILVEYEDGHRDVFNHSQLESYLEDELERTVDLVMERSGERSDRSRIRNNIEDDLIRV